MNYVQQVNGHIPPPRSYQMELVWGCNLRCWFCGIHTIPAKTLKYMDLELASSFAHQLQSYTPKTRIEFGTGGESTLHPDFFTIIHTLRQDIPLVQVMVQTNTEAWAGARSDALDQRTAQFIDNFFAMGGNILVLNCYLKGRYEQFKEWLPTTKYRWVDFYYDNPQRLSPYHYHGSKERLIFLSNDLGEMTVQHEVTKQKVSQRWLNNQGGAVLPAAYKKAGKPLPVLPLTKSCNVPFLQLVLNYDGTVPLCCYDWTDRLLLGKIPEQTVQEIWEGRQFQIMRTLLARHNREALPCATCDFHGGFRKGLTVAEPPGMPANVQLLSELEAHRVARAPEELLTTTHMGAPPRQLVGAPA